jgi:predicted acyltransferase (DUF342 family)
MPKYNLLRAAICVAAFTTVLSRVASTEAATINAEAAALAAGGDVWLGSGSEVSGTVLSGESVSAGSEVYMRSLYAEGSIWLGHSATVRGNVLANGAAEADRNLDIEGNWTGERVWIGRDLRAVGDVQARDGSLQLDRNALVDGSIRGNAGVNIGRDGYISGDARAGYAGGLQTDRNVIIEGSTSPGSFNVDTLTSVGLEGDWVATPGNAGSESFWVPRNDSLSLDAGSYGSVQLDRNTSLSLSAGTYDIGGFWMNRDSVVQVDTTLGDVILNVQGTFGTGRDVRFVTTGPGALTVNVFGHDAYLGRRNELTGQVNVLGGGFGTDRNSLLTGRFFATGDMSLGSGTVVNYSSQAIPEPAMIAVLLTGGSILLRRRRRAGIL